MLLHSSCADDVSNGVKLVESRVIECEKLNCVIRINPSESWLIPKYFGASGNLVSQIQSEYDCKISAWKNELMVCISSNDKENVIKAKQSLDTIIEQARKENICIEIPESAVNLFIGKSGINMKRLAKSHGVQIERVKKSLTKFRVIGDETSVSSAVSAIDTWVKSWDDKNKGNVMVFDSSELSFLLADNKFTMKNLERSHGVKIDVDTTKSSIVVRSKSKRARDAASSDVESLVENFREKQAIQEEAVVKKDDGTENYDKHEVSQPILQSQKTELLPKLNVNNVVEAPAVLEDITQKVDVISTKQAVKQNKAAASLFNLLISDDATPAEPVLSHEQWDSSTVSSALDGDSVADNQLSIGTYYKSASGFAVRL